MFRVYVLGNFDFGVSLFVGYLHFEFECFSSSPSHVLLPLLKSLGHTPPLVLCISFIL